VNILIQYSSVKGIIISFFLRCFDKILELYQQCAIFNLLFTISRQDKTISLFKNHCRFYTHWYKEWTYKTLYTY